MTYHIKTKSEVFPYSDMNRSKSFKCTTKDSVFKSIQQRYDDIFKAISINYFDKTQIGNIINKQTKKKQQAKIRKNSLQHNKSQSQNNQTSKQQKYKIDQQFNENQQIHRLFRLGNIYNTNYRSKQNQKTKQKQVNLAQICKMSQNNTKNTYHRQYSQLNKKMQSKLWSRAMTGKKYRYLESQNKQRSDKNNCKFIKMYSKKTSQDVLQLKRSVNQLQNIATNNYGIQLQYNNDNKQNNLDVFEKNSPDVQEITHKLQEIYHQKQSPFQIDSTVQDFSIPQNFIKALLQKSKHYHTFNSFPRKLPISKYLRV